MQLDSTAQIHRHEPKQGSKSAPPGAAANPAGPCSHSRVIMAPVSAATSSAALHESKEALSEY